MRNLIVATLFLVPAAAFAGGYVVPNVNARDLAIGGAGIAAQDSASATYANPAALSKLDGLNLSVDLSLIDINSTWSDTFGAYGGVQPVSMINKAAFPPAIYAAYGLTLPNQMRLGVGAGVTIPGGGFVFWPGDWVGNGEIINVDRKVYGIYLTGGLQVLPQLRLGGGLVYYRTTERLTKGVNFLDQRGQIELGTAGGALSYDLSAEATPFRDIPLTVGIDYKHQGVQNLEGHAHGTDIPAALKPNLLDQSVTHKLIYPNQLNVGVSYRPIAPLLLAFGWTWERFHVYTDDTFTGDRGVTVIVPRDYKNGYTLRLGTEYAGLPGVPGLKLRAGILRDISPSRPETTSPTLPDSDVTAISFGVGYAITPALEISGTYFHAFYDQRTTVGTETFQGTYDTRTNIYSISVTWKGLARQ